MGEAYTFDGPWQAKNVAVHSSSRRILPSSGLAQRGFLTDVIVIHAIVISVFTHGKSSPLQSAQTIYSDNVTKRHICTHMHSRFGRLPSHANSPRSKPPSDPDPVERSGQFLKSHCFKKRFSSNGTIRPAVLLRQPPIDLQPPIET